ncbi:hypothetical protein F4803DRAFT_498569 [Xylaria telfairii]|nr:hypothetical protein F4803DRAFT_498569 [Xylaria telfairii]
MEADARNVDLLGLARPMTEAGDAFFRGAQLRFQGLLASQDRESFGSFCSAQCLIEFVQWQAEQNRFCGPIHTICQAINNLGESLRPYFAIINTFVSSNPEIAGLIWGGLQFMLQLCRNYSTFLEKLAFLFTEIAVELDVFKGASDLGTIDKAITLANDEKINVRIMIAMSWLYTDILDLCYYFCRTFSSTQKSKVKKMQNLVKMLWTPFDQRFGDFKKRLSLHQRILGTAIQEYTAKTVELTYAKLDMLFRSYNVLSDGQKALNQCYQDELLARRVEYIKSWVNPPPWQSVAEDLKAKKSPSTSNWILQHPSYRWWQGGSPDVIETLPDVDQLPGRSLGNRTLMIYGKPGYGKSMLCTTIIDKLSTKTDTIGEQLERKKWNIPIAFYMFDKRRPDSQNSESAMRAILAQLLHYGQFNTKLVDYALLLKDVQGSGQLIASANETRTLLQFFVEKLQCITLVFDGLDECLDATEFLSQLGQITSATTSRTLLFSRPNVTLDGTWIGEKRIVHLSGQENLEDIRTYLTIGLKRLVASEKLITDRPVEMQASDLAQRSHSMFLWASIMINYLDSDFLSPQDREDAMSEMCSFEELDQLYVSILNRLYQTCRGAKARQNSQRIFQWVYAAYRPLRVEELRVALSIKAGSPTRATQLMKSFENALPKMTGSLLEIGQDRAIRPIHTSFLEFFAQMQETTTSTHLQCHFKFDGSTAQHLVTIDCLSYMLLDAPKEPLAQLSQTDIISQTIVHRYPLLLYASEFWVSHAAGAIQSGIMAPSQSIPANHSLRGLMLKYINDFINSKLTVTGWIEASWFFGSPPSLHQLDSLVNTIQLPNILQLGERLAKFASELQILNSRWGTVLQGDPGEIWQPSISAFMKPQFWISSNQARVTELDSQPMKADNHGHEQSNDTSCILIASQSSISGTEVGWIKVWPSRYFVENIKSETEPDFHKMSSEWIVSYDIKQLVDGLLTHHIKVQLPEISVLSIVKKARLNTGQFDFPVAFSYDLRQITVLNYLIRIHSSSTDVMREDFSVQSLEINQTGTRGRDGTELGPFPWYSIIFSPSARYIAVLGGRSKPGPQSNAYGERQAIVLEDRSETWETPAFHVLETIHLRISPLIQTRFWAFHPSQPALAIAGLGETNLWFFKQPVRWVNMPVGAPLDNLSFSKCGNYLHGIVCGRSREFRVICIRDYFEEPKGITSRGQNNDTQVAAVHQSEQLSLARRTKAEIILTPESIIFDNVAGRPQISMLQQLNDEGAVILQKSRDDGTIQSQCLTRLPKFSSLEKSYATLVSKLSTSESDPIQLVINKAMEDTYSSESKPDMSLPLLITRNAESIPRWTSKHKLALELPDNNGSQRRRIT